MIFIMAYKLVRKNARRKIYVKIDALDQTDAIRQFGFYCRDREPIDDKPKVWELLTGDWKHITFYCNSCHRCMDERCVGCPKRIEINERNVNNETNDKMS